MPEERRALGAFQARERVTLVTPVAGSPTATRDYDAEVALRVESALDEAQTLATSLDEERALAILNDVERQLLSHPELPQAAWLMAERYELAGDILRKQPGKEADAALFAQRAEALEGPRAASFGDAEGTALPPAPARTSLSIKDLDAGDTLVLDGRAAPREASVLPGLHHARVTRGSFVVWTGFFEVAGESRVRKTLGVPVRLACSEQDLAEVADGSFRPSAPRGVRCERWMAVRRGRAGLEIARCERDACGAFSPLPPDKAAERATIPPWLAATIVGAATLGAGALLVFTGAFDREEPPPTTTWVYPGSK
jgi:hypothetical protein